MCNVLVFCTGGQMDSLSVCSVSCWSCQSAGLGAGSMQPLQRARREPCSGSEWADMNHTVQLSLSLRGDSLPTVHAATRKVRQRRRLQPWGGALLSLYMEGTSREDKKIKERGRRKTCLAHYEVNFLKWFLSWKIKCNICCKYIWIH